MKKSMRKCSQFIILVALVFSILTVSVYGAETWEPIASFSVWHSDSDSIGVFTGNTVKVYSDYTYMSFFTMDELCRAVQSAWGSVIPFEFVSSEDECDIIFKDILREDIPVTEGIDSRALGYISDPEFTVYGYAVYGSTRKTIKEYSKVTVHIIIESEDFILTNDLYEKWETIAIHEFGHALGYYGHDLSATANNKSIMYPYLDTILNEWGINRPQPRDYAHLSGVYSLFR